MSKQILALMTMVVLVSIALVACGGGGTEPAPAAPQRPSPPVVPPANTTAPTAPSSTGQTTGAGTQVTVSLQDPGGSGSYKFDSSDFTFSAGETVSFTFNAESEFHTFTVDGLDIDVAVDGGSSETLTFTFDTPGEYKIFCVPHEGLGMVGTITVN
ncbi:MAG: cupredoxin domain-containing protein [Chloroflexi bacterium]|nr:cupredoxin domain-containing protein [Chloroflexota bacterium]